MRHYLDELLKALEKSYPGGLTVSELREKFSSDTDQIIHDAVRGKLILYPIYDLGGNFRDGDIIYLDVNGFGLLNQMKMKEAVDTLDNSIKGFNNSSDKYSKELVGLTRAIYTFTIITVALPIYEKIIQIYEVSPLAEIVWLFVGVLGIVAFMLLYFHFNDSMRIKDPFNNLRDNFNNLLDNYNLNCPKDKKRLIELLLIIGSLIVAFKTPEDLKGNNIAIQGSSITLYFMIFAFLSILYFILIENEKIKLTNYIPFFIGISFSAIMAIILSISTTKVLGVDLYFTIIYLVYFIPFTFFIWGALRKKYP